MENAELTGITVYGNGLYYAERLEHAGDDDAIDEATIGTARLVFPPGALLDVDAPLADHPESIRRLAQAYRSSLEVVFRYEPGEFFLTDLIDVADGWHLLRALEGQHDGWGVSAHDANSAWIAHRTLTPAVQQALITHGVQIIRFHDHDHERDSGPRYYVVDRRVIHPLKVIHDEEAAASLALLSVAALIPDHDMRAILRDQLNDDWRTLDEEARGAVCAVVGACRRGGNLQRQVISAGEAYAYPHPGGGISWGVDNGSGLGPRGVQRLVEDEQPYLVTPERFAALTSLWQAVADPAAEARDPARAKQLLAAADAHWVAVQHWSGPDRELPAAEQMAVQKAVDLIADRRSAIHDAVARHSVDPAWRQAFDAAGWPSVQQAPVVTVAAPPALPRLGIIDTIAGLFGSRMARAAARGEAEPITAISSSSLKRRRP
jgi:hypothetical protein